MDELTFLREVINLNHSIEQTKNNQCQRSYFAFAFDDFQMMVTGRQKLLTILFMVFLGTILIYKARGFGSEKVNNFQTTFGIGR